LADNHNTTTEELKKDPAKTPEAGDARSSEETPKKKKKIIFVSNPQNSKMVTNKPKTAAPSGAARAQGAQARPSTQSSQSKPASQGKTGGNAAPKAAPQPNRPIKPLTPPSPTPSVQMVSSKPQPAAKKELRTEENVEVAVKNKEAEEIQKPKTDVSVKEEQNKETAVKEVANSEPVKELQEKEVQREQRKEVANVAERTAHERRPAQDKDRSRERTQGERPQGERSRDRNQSERPQGGFRNQGEKNDRKQGNFERQERGFGQERNNSFREKSQGERFQGERSQGGRNGAGKAEGGMQSRGGFQGAGGGRYSEGGFAGDGRGFKDNERSSRGNGGQTDRFRDNKQGKGFGGEAAPINATEKHREEEKRRISQEKDKRNKKDHFYEEEEALKNKPGRFIKPEKKKEEVVEEVIKVIVLPETITIKDLADKMKMQPAAIIKKLFMQGKIVTVNQEISYEDAENIAMEYDILCEKEVQVDVIEELLKEEEDSEDNLVERPPVICVMGHVDHGKTSLLDAIRKTNVTDKEAGGITQHIGAYTVKVGDRKITFLDTPGHEAFTAMRMRGANATDIAILVVAADDGVMPQTVEAINHAKAAGIEIIVAVNKIDKPSANIDRVMQELTEYELVAEDWGGSTVFAPVSAKTGEGIQDLLDMILLSADILELRANPNRQARGLVIEAELDKGRGPVATVLVQKGTLHVGDFISAGACYGKVRAMIDDKGRRIKEATPSTPVEILGLSAVPSAGEVFLAHENDKTAKSYAETYEAQNKEKMLEETKARMSLDDLFSHIQEGNLKELNLIVKADVQGSVEAVKQSLLKLSNEEVVVKCIHGGVGAINESDIMLASASNAIIIGFNVRPDATAKVRSEEEGVDIRLYKVIYQAIEDIEAAMKGMLDPVFEEKVIGHAEVRQIFRASAVGNIAGSYVMDGIFQRGCNVRVSREGKQIYEGKLASLKRFKDDVKEVKTGFECGLVFDGFDQMQELDIVEAYIMVEVPR